MRIRLIIGLTLVAALTILSSCVSFETNLYRSEGTWEVVSSNVDTYLDNEFQGSESAYSDSSEVLFQFFEDGTGKVTEDGTAESFDWTYQEEPEALVLSVDGDMQEWEIRESDRTTMKLFYSFEFEFFGITTRNDFTIDLEKQ